MKRRRVWDCRPPHRRGVLLGPSRLTGCRIVQWDGRLGAKVVRAMWLRHLGDDRRALDPYELKLCL